MGQSNPNSNQCLIAAIGASAGGLEAFEKFFKHMPVDAGMAFAVVQHLAPDRESALPQLLAKYTGMPVEQVQNNTKVLPNCVYVIPPNATLTIENCVLRVKAPAELRGHRTPIDSLFRSLAEDQAENGVCILLSGTGTDGTLGLRAIKEHGGMAMAQTLESAKYDAILRSAIATGLVDHVLPAEEMPAKLMEYAAHLKSLDGKPDGIRKHIVAHLGKITGVLRRKTGHDFSQYKENTIARRLERRMKVLQIETVEQYVEFLERQPKEADLLFKDLLIGVTEFFRDSEAFEALSREAIPKLFEGKGAGTQVRVCVVGCASGEEAYSIAILLCEHASTLAVAPEIKIFATDIDERGLEMARKGRYPAKLAEHLSAERLERFFVKQEGAYQIKRELREMCIFSVHSFIKDPPFSRLDLISCRNVMIYLGLDLQRKIIPLFHYALRPGGYLFLGPSESVASHTELFRAIDKKHHIFERKQSLPRPVVQFPLADISQPPQFGGKQPENQERNLSKELERIILRRYAPACVIVKENGDAVYFSGPISRYLEQPAGTPDNNVLNMACEGLRMPLRRALHKASTAHERTVQKGVTVKTSGGAGRVNLSVEPMMEFQDAGLYVVTLEEEMAAGGGEQHGQGPPSEGSSDDAIRRLESELRFAQEHLKATVEELETSNEELRSANEEFHSTNEELETSQEELQSFNEELETVNSELNRKIAELDHSNSDLQNLLESTQIATIFLDGEFRIKSFTPAALGMFRLIAGDVGRPITDLAAQFAEADLVEDSKEVLKTLTSRERQLTAHGRHYQMRILPYRTVHNVVDGVVITFVDVTQLKQAERLARDAQAYAENIVATIREPLLVLDDNLRVRSANKAFYDTFQAARNETEGRLLYDLGNRQWDIPELRLLLSELLPRNQIVENFQIERDFSGLGPRTMVVNANRIEHMQLILLAIEDITARRRAENSLRDVNQDLKYFSYATSHDLQEPLRMVTSYTQLLGKQYRGKLDERADQFIAYAVEGALRMEKLLQDLLEYWSLQDEGTEQHVPVDCNTVLKKALKHIEGEVQESGAVVTHDPLPTIVAQELPLVLLFKNLIGNALKYRRTGEPARIHIDAGWDAEVWSFSVADNGIGMEERHLEEIFVPFKRLHGTEYPGTGLGLAICQRIVQRYRGRIWAESTVGEGSTFHFTIPVSMTRRPVRDMRQTGQSTEQALSYVAKTSSA